MAPYLIYLLSIMSSLNSAPPGENFFTLHKDYMENVYKLPEGVAISDEYKMPTVSADKATVNSLIKLSANYLGYPYVWGGTTERGFDCSGFVYFLFNKIGKPIPRMPADQCLRGDDIKFQDIEPGDLIFFSGSNSNSKWIGHVGMAFDRDSNGNIRFIHAESKRTGVIITSLEQQYYKKRFIRATRIIK
ncbi:MAG: C40 family peptidase [Ignavibacteriales bacterium]|nr:MAG: NlpC/P60 family protein [Ignavibacteriaceae bacterium]MBW7873996.1 C40 family peptidase [Ignavibacteria bacterium]MCZ2143097.1 C40 family peptidase [Ignavibacteriales bacterium]OQY78760.1 MAG: hypothetical protein B6D45_01915 [Ignavibacteriales bacterium UTCHB3]MBV6443978.1 hypothetical protein [Ignavibacteriaceae bacterium]